VARHGERLDAVCIAVARAAGLRRASVRRPTLGLIPADAPDAPTSALLASIARRRGAQVVLLPPGDPAALGGGELDCLLVLGEPGESLANIAAAGGRVVAQALALRPGEDGALSRLGPAPCLHAPDRLADALALALAILLPTLDHLAAAATSPGPTSPLARKLASTVGVAELALFRSGRAGLEPLAIADLPLSAIASADRWALVPPDHEGHAPGDEIGTWGWGG
jgi:molybdopterin biosynthesis enzyme